ncbi:sigma-70 family RNA polymerase sigma factor [Frigoriglobus tundricola]|uniref:ECF RNA polymerase sigma factor SigE n=1 Tax=Frigoriglobus tundricola TaxID=2774151 RepID=A0A6M5YN68_9BACT|nr:sigma-70 family RNA polymerase sigma factor [Frigoriglobus tundricola]QJW94810.1 hypothetical protein FTUN_2334 [Frigoriglobus tundricola]
MSARRTAALRKVVRTVAAPDRGGATDRELLDRFVRENDQSAFETLVTRHTGMVLGVCRRALPKVQDAEDACQATFMVLARKAGAGHWQESVANWLYTTARKVARNARVAAERRARREETVAVPESVEPVDRMTGRELLAALDAALDGLPARYREPLVLCYLEGLTRDEAAYRLGVPLATLHTRIDRARKRLHEVLTKAGCALGAGLLALAASSPAGASPQRLVKSVLASVSGSAPAAVGELAKRAAMNGLFKTTVFALAVVGIGALCVGLVALGSTRAASEAPEPVSAPASANGAGAAAPPAEVNPAGKRVEVRGTVLGPDDKPVGGAKLFLRHWDGSRDRTVPAPQVAAGADGTFAFTMDDSEMGTLVATAPGHGLAWASLYFHPVPALTLHLTPDEPIRGRVMNLEGKPVAGVTVSVTGMFQPHKEKTLDRWLKSVRNPKDEEGVSVVPLYDYVSGFAGLLVPVTSDRDGKFEIRGLGRDRVAILRATGPAIATHELRAVTREVERFNDPLNNWGTIQGADPVVVAAPVPVTTGRVIDSASGKPIPGTVLHVEHLSQSLSATADKDGRFTLPGLPQGKPGLSVIVIPPGRAPYHPVREAVPDDATERAAFDVKLVRGIPATVKIIDKVTRKPVKSHIRYGVFPDDNPNVKAVPNVWHDREWSDAPDYIPRLSEFHIVVFPGKGLLAASAGWPQGGNYLSGVGVAAFEKYRHEGQLYGLVGATNIHVHEKHTFAAIDVPADAKEFHFTLELDPGLTMSGRLIDADGKPVVGAESFGLRNAPGDGNWAPPASDEKFAALALRDGEKRRVMFVHSERKLAGTAVVVGGAKEPVEVRMQPWGEATGRMVGADGKPVPGRIDLIYDVVRHPDLKLGSSPLCQPGSAGPEAGPDGRFRVTGLVPGLTYRWVASGWKHGEAVLPDTIAKSGQTIDLGDVVVRPKQP